MQFTGVQPQVVNGRVLIPSRGVLEQMGAYVGWDAATRAVIAQRGDKDVSLPIGSRTATVNGQLVTLDVPAMIISGTTMVPLRFLSEALGAGVVWDNATRTVAITTAGTTPTPTPTPTPTSGTVQITSFTHSATGWLRAGDRLQVTMIGTPGVVNKTNMPEVSSGRYVGTWTVPSNAPSISGASVIGQLIVGGRERLIQAGNPVNVDTKAPVIRNQTPAPNSQVPDATPAISAVTIGSNGQQSAPRVVQFKAK